MGEAKKEGKNYKCHPNASYGHRWTLLKGILVTLFIFYVFAVLIADLLADFASIYYLVLIAAIAISAFVLLVEYIIGRDKLPKTISILIVVIIVTIVAFIVASIFVMINKHNLIPIVVLIAFFVGALIMAVVKVIWERGWGKGIKKALKSNSNEEVCAQKALCDLDAWEAYKQADNLYHQRFNFFLVAESMLVVSFATTFSSGCLNINPLRIAITILGMIFTFSWFYVNNGIGYRMIYLREKYLRRCNQTFKHYIESVEGLTIPSSFFMTDLLPAATFAFWCYLFYYTLVF